MKKHPILLFLTLSLAMSSCNWISHKAKTTANKTGEIVAKTGSEFGNGVYKGIHETFENNISLSEQLKKSGLKIGQVTINSTDSTSDNVLTTYLIFDNDFDGKITIKLFDENGKEYGRLTQTISGKKGEAKYFDFTFDKRVNIGVKGKITVE